MNDKQFTQSADRMTNVILNLLRGSDYEAARDVHEAACEARMALDMLARAVLNSEDDPDAVEYALERAHEVLT